MYIKNSITGRDVRMFLSRTARAGVRVISPATKPVNKATIFVVTGYLKARAALKGHSVPFMLRMLAMIFDICMFPVLYPYNWSKNFVCNIWAGTAPIKGLPYVKKG